MLLAMILHKDTASRIDTCLPAAAYCAVARLAIPCATRVDPEQVRASVHNILFLIQRDINDIVASYENHYQAKGISNTCKLNY